MNEGMAIQEPPAPKEIAASDEQPVAVTIEETDTSTVRQLIQTWQTQLGYPKNWDLAGILDYKSFDTAFVARKDQATVGVVTLKDNEVVGLYVLPEERSHGYAEALLKQAATYCQERGFEKVTIDVADQRAEALVRKLMTDPAYADRFEITEAYRD